MWFHLERQYKGRTALAYWEGLGLLSKQESKQGLAMVVEKNRASMLVNFNMRENMPDYQVNASFFVLTLNDTSLKIGASYSDQDAISEKARNGVLLNRIMDHVENQIQVILEQNGRN